LIRLINAPAILAKKETAVSVYEENSDNKCFWEETFIVFSSTKWCYLNPVKFMNMASVIFSDRRHMYF